MLRAFIAPSGGLSGLPNEAALAVTAMPAAAIAPAVLVNILRRERFVMFPSSSFQLIEYSLPTFTAFSFFENRHAVTQVKYKST
ncbi:hypothetical protein [Burkholderia ambifaria]|uniref:hypothetical protein n=1 Tax=Burkholderia ambifaria TaxID=152480 RepID=UPI001F4560E6|nr:hypothetical protein [Burkholderia ambifaria]MDP9585433.1 hypothetical protein [Burkholderia contaminans]